MLASSPGGGRFFRFFVKHALRHFARIDPYHSLVLCIQKNSGVAGRPLSISPRRPWFESGTTVSFFFFSFFSCVKIFTTIEKSVLYAYVQSTAASAADLSLTAIAAAAAALLLPAAVRHRVPDSQICCWFIESDPSVFFSSFKRDLLWMVPLGSAVSYLRPRFAYIFGKYGHARSQDGRQPAAVKPPS